MRIIWRRSISQENCSEGEYLTIEALSIIETDQDISIMAILTNCPRVCEVTITNKDGKQKAVWLTLILVVRTR